jgi:hypothetical protein
MNIIDEITSEPLASPADLIEKYEESLNEPSARWAFRGQSQAYGTLVPSFQRIFGQKHYIGAAEVIEQDLIKTFRKHYATLPGKTDGMPPPDSLGPGYNLRCLSVMQHYSVPTRLLDWTSDFWTAVYFACAGDPTKEAELWVYDRTIFGNQLNERPDLRSLTQRSIPGSPPPPEPDLLAQRGGSLIFELDPQITPRMKQQFAHHTLSSDIFADHAPLLFNLGGQNENLIGLKRALIASGCKKNVLRFLEEQRGVTAGTIFPDVEGLSKFLHWHLESMITTLL